MKGSRTTAGTVTTVSKPRAGRGRGGNKQESVEQKVGGTLKMTLKKTKGPISGAEAVWSATRHDTISQSSSSDEMMSMDGSYRHAYGKRALPDIFGEDQERLEAPKRRRVKAPSSAFELPNLSTDDRLWSRPTNSRSETTMSGGEDMTLEYETDANGRLCEKDRSGFSSISRSDSSRRYGVQNPMWSSTMSSRQENEYNDVVDDENTDVPVDENSDVVVHESSDVVVEETSDVVVEEITDEELESQETLYRECTEIEGTG